MMKPTCLKGGPPSKNEGGISPKNPLNDSRLFGTPPNSRKTPNLPRQSRGEKPQDAEF